MIIATAGHVDHGKTALIRALTGADTDRLPEEKQRGMSIDLGFAYADLGGRRLGFIDVPGHQKFIRNLLAGVAGIDFALLIVAADDGVMPQTIEHVAILDMLGITRGAVALSKIDRVEPARIDEVSLEVRAMLAGTSLANAPVLPLSSLSGEGVGELRTHLAAAAAAFSAREPAGNFRLAIDRCFSLRGIGLTVTGTVFSGVANLGDTLMLSPSGDRVRVRGIHANDQPAQQAVAGSRCAINIAASGGGTPGKDAIERGHWLCDPNAPAPTARFDARITLLASETAPVKHMTPVHAHVGAAHMPGRVALLQGAPLSPGRNGLLQVVLDRPLSIARGDRIILRDASAQRTIGGGVVIDPFAPGRGRARPERLAALNALEQLSARQALDELLALSAGGVALDRFARGFNLTPAEAEALWQSAPMHRFGRGADLTGISDAHYAALVRRIPELLAERHRQNPQILGPNAQELLRALHPVSSAALLSGAVQQLQAAGTVARTGTLLHLHGQSIKPNPQDARQWQALQPLFEAAQLTPPRTRELAQAIGKPSEAVEALLTRLARAGLVTRVSDNRFFTQATLRALAVIAENAAAASQDARFTAAQYRIASGIGRNLTIEVLEYFDRAGFTRRLGEGRIVRAPAGDIFGE